MGHGPEAFTEPPGNLGGGKGDTDVDDQRNRRQPREQPEQEQRSKDDFHDSNKGSCKAGSGNADARETSDAKSFRKEKLLYPLGEENAPNEKTNQMTAHGASIFKSRSRVVTNASCLPC